MSPLRGRETVNGKAHQALDKVASANVAYHNERRFVHMPETPPRPNITKGPWGEDHQILVARGAYGAICSKKIGLFLQREDGFAAFVPCKGPYEGSFGVRDAVP